MRSVRPAPNPLVFNQRIIPIVTGESVLLPLYRLFRKKYPNQFYPSAESRLTPRVASASSSLDLAQIYPVPCVYLASNYETAVAEVWGDRFAAQQHRGASVFTIVKSVASEYAYLRLDGMLQTLRICDLSDQSTRLAVGIENSTLYHTDLTIPQEWAFLIYIHPLKFDAIAYRSRHTDQICYVIWDRGAGQMSSALDFTPDSEFVYSIPAYTLAKRMGLRLSFG